MPDADRPRPVRLPWREAVVLVCSECDGTKGLSPKKARKALKSRAKTDLPKKAVRVLATGCMDACPKGGVTVATAGVKESAVVVRSREQCGVVIDDLAEQLGSRG